MEYTYLSDTVKIKKVSENDTEGVFEIGGLYKGYGVMVGNSIRRVLLSSLPGAAITRVKIKSANHEFTTLTGVLEDVVEITLNLKRVRFRIHTNEPQVLTLKAKGDKKVTAADIETNQNVELVSPDVHLATLTDKKADLDIEITVEKGLGYVPVEVQKTEKLPVGVIAIDAIFSPVMKVNFSVEDMRVGDRADYNRVVLSISTDGSITPSAALRKASKILEDHYVKISGVEVVEAKPVATAKKESKTKKKAAPEKTTGTKAKKAAPKKSTKE